MQGVYEEAILKTLAKARASDSGVFERNNTMRRSPARAELRKTTGLTDEQIEGWFVMVLRDVRPSSHFPFSSFPWLHGCIYSLFSFLYSPRDTCPRRKKGAAAKLERTC